MIACCPTCHTLFRHRLESATAARCGRCGAAVAAGPSRSYRVRALGRTKTLPVAATASRPAHAFAGVGFDDPSLAPAFAEAADAGRAGAWTYRWVEPGDEEVDRATGEAAIDSRLEELAREAAAAGGSDRSIRSVLFGIGIGALSGVAASKGLVETPWVGWAAGGFVGGLAGALWDRARSWRNR